VGTIGPEKSKKSRARHLKVEIMKDDGSPETSS
jgi:hypothetical protein